MCGRPFDMQYNRFVFVFFSVKSCSRSMWTLKFLVFQANESNLYCTSERVYSMENRHFKLILPHWFRHKLYCVLFDAPSIDWPTCACFWKCDCAHVLMQPMLLGVLACYCSALRECLCCALPYNKHTAQTFFFSNHPSTSVCDYVFYKYFFEQRC